MLGNQPLGQPDFSNKFKLNAILKNFSAQNGK